jgi:16S rRNA (uracil1498-N3)-methyltransferase
MRQDRIFISEPLGPGMRVELPPHVLRHVVQVLRLGPEAPLILFNGDGYDYGARLAKVSSRAAVAEVDAPTTSTPEPVPPLRITLALGVTKGERMDYALQKAVELGAETLVPLFTERSVVRLRDDRLEKRLRHWQGVVIAACEQCGRRRIPTLATPESLGARLDGRSAPPGLGILLHHLAEQTLVELPAPQGEVELLVGPEGGLAPAERAAALDRGYVAARLGPRVLRAETAPLAALAVVQALWGDFRL